MIAQKGVHEIITTVDYNKAQLEEAQKGDYIHSAQRLGRCFPEWREPYLFATQPGKGL